METAFTAAYEQASIALNRERSSLVKVDFYAFGMGAGFQFKIILEPAGASMKNKVDARIDAPVSDLAEQRHLRDPRGWVKAVIVVSDATGSRLLTNIGNL